MKSSTLLIPAGLIALAGVATSLGCYTKTAFAPETPVIKDQVSTSPAPWSIVEEEDFWIPLRFEPLFALDNARAAFRRHEEQAAADSIEKSVSWLRLAALHARPVTRVKLLDAAAQLKDVGVALRAGDVAAAAKLGSAIAFAAQGLAAWNYYKVTEFWGRNEERAAGRDLEVAAKYLQQAADSAHYEFGPNTRETITEVFTKGKATSATTYSHNALATNIEGIQKATAELATAMQN